MCACYRWWVTGLWGLCPLRWDPMPFDGRDLPFLRHLPAEEMVCVLLLQQHKGANTGTGTPAKEDFFFSTESIMITVQLELLAHPAWSRKPPPNPSYSESLQTKERCPEAQFCILGSFCRFHSWGCQMPKPPLNCPAFDLGTNPDCGRHIMAPLLPPIKPPWLSLGVQVLWPWSLRSVNPPRSCIAQYSCYTYLFWLDLAYCIGRDTYYGVCVRERGGVCGRKSIKNNFRLLYNNAT